VSNKVAIFLFEPLTGDVSRAYRGLKVAQEFANAGDEVVVVFDGSGVETLAAIADPSHKLNGLLRTIHESVGGACSFCADSHKVREAIVAAGYPLLADYDGEASVRNFVTDGYTILTF
jgi:NAD(P)-dependent dehydrogenase (short-subunit alcohol dehydrogenase family)